MAAAVAFDGRALPVAWRRCPNQEWPMELAELIAETLGWFGTPWTTWATTGKR